MAVRFSKNAEQLLGRREWLSPTQIERVIQNPDREYEGDSGAVVAEGELDGNRVRVVYERDESKQEITVHTITRLESPIYDPEPHVQHPFIPRGMTWQEFLGDPHDQ
jgi:hypothetical protein